MFSKYFSFIYKNTKHVKNTDSCNISQDKFRKVFHSHFLKFAKYYILFHYLIYTFIPLKQLPEHKEFQTENFLKQKNSDLRNNFKKSNSEDSKTQKKINIISNLYTICNENDLWLQKKVQHLGEIKLKIVGINSSTLSGKQFSWNTAHIFKTHLLCVYKSYKCSSRTDPRNILPREEELLRFMEETDFLVSFCLQTT